LEEATRLYDKTVLVEGMLCDVLPPGTRGFKTGEIIRALPKVPSGSALATNRYDVVRETGGRSLQLTALSRDLAELGRRISVSRNTGFGALSEAASPPSAPAEKDEGESETVTTPDDTTDNQEPPKTTIIPPEIDADTVMQRIIRCVGDSKSKKTGKDIATALKMPYSGHLKEKLAALRKMNVFTAGHGYPLSDEGQKIYRALKDRKKSS